MANTATHGRPTKFTKEVRKKILWALRLGNYRRIAAGYGGVAERTLCDWLARGRDEETGPYSDFRQEVLEAEQTAEVRALGVIQQAQSKDWKAAAWFLERKFPERFCTRAAVFLAKRLAVDEGMPIEEMNEEESVDLILNLLQDLAPTLPRARLLAVINAVENP